MSIELNRSAFEAFAQRNEFGTYRTDRKGDGYDSSHTQLMWLAWCAAIQQAESEPALPDGYVVAPHFRGYARLGIGAYLINHSAPGHEPELVISAATEDEKAGRSVGEERDNAPGSEIQPEQISVRLCFENVAGLDALEKQLRYLREVHFSGTHPDPGVPEFSRIAIQQAEETPSTESEPVTVESVATVRRGKLSWLIEGGVAALPDGVVLLIADSQITDNSGSGEVYTHPDPGVPDDVVRDAERYRWLRSLEHCNEAWCFIGSGNANSNLDAAIDAAMLAAKTGGAA